MINICCALCTHTRARIFNLPCGEYTLKLIGKFEMPLEEPVTLSVSSSISLRIDKKSINFANVISKTESNYKIKYVSIHLVHNFVRVYKVSFLTKKEKKQERSEFVPRSRE